jgi:hypothetical protein
MKKTNTLTAFIFFVTINIFSQTQDPLGFWPHHAGDIYQYRDVVNNQIVYTKVYDSVWVNDNDIFIKVRSTPGTLRFEKIDTAFNLFNLTFQPNYPRYKLAASIGDSWVAGVHNEDTIIVTLSDIYEDFVLGVWATIKVFTFEIIYPNIPDPSWLGDDHLAMGFGLVFSSIEGGGAPYLAGAIIDSVLYGHVVSVEPTEPVPDEFIIFQNYPNPFNPLTTIEFDLPAETYGSINIYNILGENVSTLFNGLLRSGTHKYIWDASGFSSGIYLCRLNVNGTTKTIKMLLTK